jgi:hypothetical protein
MPSRINGSVFTDQTLTGSLKHYQLVGADFSNSFSNQAPKYGAAAEEVARVITQNATIVIFNPINIGISFALESDRSNWTTSELQSAIRALGASVGSDNVNLTNMRLTEVEYSLFGSEFVFVVPDPNINSLSVNNTYFITESTTLELPDYNDPLIEIGSLIRFFKYEGIAVTLNAHNGQDIRDLTEEVTDTSYTYDYDEEIILLFDGVRWAVYHDDKESISSVSGLQAVLDDKVNVQDLSDLPISSATQVALNRVLHTTSTGLSQGGLISINADDTKFDISAGFGYIVNGHTDVEVPTSTKIQWTEKLAIVPTYISSHNASYVGIDYDGNVFQSAADFTATERRNYIRLGLLVHPNRTNIFIQNNAPTLNVELGAQVQDILNILGFRSITGNRILPIGTGMTIKKELGTAFKAGANFNTLNTQPHSFILDEQAPIVFRYRLQDGTESATTSTLNPQIYDLNGVFTAIPATATLASVQQVYIFQEGDVRIQPGQKYYNNLTEAVTGINSATFITEENVASNALYLGSIVMIYGTTSLNNILQAVFVPSQGTTTNGSASTPPLGYVAEDESNKQSTLAPDSTGTKYPSVEALQQQTEITTAETLIASDIGKYIFCNPATAISITVDYTQLAVKHSNYFKNESAHDVTFVANAGNSTVLTGANGLVLQPGGTAYLLRKGNANTTYIEIYNPV